MATKILLTPHRIPHQLRQLTNLRMRQRPLPHARLNQTLPPNCRDVIRLRCGICTQTRLPHPQQEMRWPQQMNRSRKRHNQHRVRTRMLVPPVGRYDHHRTLALLGRIGRQIRPPNFALSRQPRRTIQRASPASSVSPNSAHSFSSARSASLAAS
jgi:hypothetical protein